MPDPNARSSRSARAPQTPSSASTRPAAPAEALPDALARRVVVEHVKPEIDAGRFPIKRTPGERSS